MTKEDWKKIQDWWGIGQGSINMLIDGYKLSLYNLADAEKMMLFVMVYVDDVCKYAYMNIENEIGNKFFQRKKKALYSNKALKERSKIFGKRSKEAEQVYYEYNDLYWRSFLAFKKHLLANSKTIELIEK